MCVGGVCVLGSKYSKAVLRHAPAGKHVRPDDGWMRVWAWIVLFNDLTLSGGGVVRQPLCSTGLSILSGCAALATEE